MRRFTTHDRAACLAIFDSNLSPYFAPSDRDDFERFLERIPGVYDVIEHEGRVIACGGWARSRDEARVAILTWGMVHRDFHRQGFGTKLVRERIAEIPRADFDTIELTTSQHASPFYARESFELITTIPNHFAPGLDAHIMRAAAPRGLRTRGTPKRQSAKAPNGNEGSREEASGDDASITSTHHEHEYEYASRVTTHRTQPNHQRGGAPEPSSPKIPFGALALWRPHPVSCYTPSQTRARWLHCSGPG